MLRVSVQSPLLSPAHQSLFPALCTRFRGLVFSPPRCTRFPSKRCLQAFKAIHWSESVADRQRRWLVVPKALDSGTDQYSGKTVKKRKVVEHIFLMKAKVDLSDEEEKDMLDYLYTSQYQMRGIIAVSLGRIADPNPEGFTHCVYMRFQKTEDLSKFYTNPYYLGVLKDHVIPNCYESISIDYESEVEDDILPIFRRGEEFNYGIEFVLMISVLENTLESAVEDALTTLRQLILEFESLIVQATLGSNLNARDNGYTHGAVIRFPSFEAFEIFKSSSEFKDMWRWKFQPITKTSLVIHFTVDPVGTELM